jgi:hypothetical protein
MDRLHLLWSINNADYNTEYPAVSALPLGSAVPVARVPLTVAAIRRNLDPTLQPAVATHFLDLSLSDPVGRGQRNNKGDIHSLQVSLRALGLLSDPDFTAESAAVSGLASTTVPDGQIPRTIAAISNLKDKIAGGRLGWAPIRADEAEAGGDRFGGQTFDFQLSSLCRFPATAGPPPRPAREIADTFGVSIFVPRGAHPGVNKVHVFFSPGEVTGDSGFNAVLMHGLRSASDNSEWILISVPGIEKGWCTIDRAGILACLTRVGRSAAIDALRLTGHSRGGAGLLASLQRSFITGPIERIAVLDCGEFFTGAWVDGWKRHGTSVTHYRVMNSLPLAGANVINLEKSCMRAIGYTRLIQDAMVTRPTLSVPAPITGQLLPLPARGSFTTSATSRAGQPNIRLDCKRMQTCFCRDRQSRIDAIIRNELDRRRGLHGFVEGNDLTRFAQSFVPGIYSHHLFVAEIAHELVA